LLGAIFSSHDGDHSAGILLEADQFSPAFDDGPAFLQRGLENLFRDALRNNEHSRLKRVASGLVSRRTNRDREQLLRARTSVQSANIRKAALGKFLLNPLDRKNF
jgi:hypothetical protein